MHSLTQSLSHWSLFNMQLFFTWTWILLRLFIKKKKRFSECKNHLTRILLIAATISIRLFGLGTSRVPTYWSKHWKAGLLSDTLQVRVQPANSVTVCYGSLHPSVWIFILKKKKKTTCSVCAVFERGKKNVNRNQTSRPNNLNVTYSKA